MRGKKGFAVGYLVEAGGRRKKYLKIGISFCESGPYFYIVNSATGA
ncbi:MAG: hypothetical protein AVDCRST_MAG56-2676 [uncultured Cytophagales bacterium]|uniref:Uncharacterized protein n=1 Tax=uncultured Cytophagales bacterium TaxID=158755 RepID=A0A6J4IZN7_9SPHI|nr:MAG: hypothetical protein AVDCRST_MAG56-2676 [uncultured Cytophagales bacterium]